MKRKIIYIFITLALIVSGDVKGDIDAGGSVTCGNVLGDIDAGGSVRCRR